MDFRDVLELGLEESRAVLYQQMEGLTREELIWQPGPENRIGREDAEEALQRKPCEYFSDENKR